MKKVKGRSPFHALITTMLSVRSKDEMTHRVAAELLSKAPTPQALCAMPLEEIERILRPLGFYRQKARNVKEAACRIANEYGGRVPDTLDELLKFRGVGRKVANIVLYNAFGKPAVGVDTHVFRIITERWRLLPDAKRPEDVERFLMESLPKDMWGEVNRYLVAFGQAICKPQNPRCDVCPLRQKCPYPGRPTHPSPLQ
ncbi:MAG: endonuclease III [Thermotogae bacterium]|nr:endonuclease III [Thermotogota bacterium]